MARSGRPNKTDSRVESLSNDIKNGNIENVKKILADVGIDAIDSFKRTSLIWASFFNKIDLLNWLFENGANINHQDMEGFSALHFAAIESQYESVKFLLLKNARIDLKDNFGNTPLMKAIFYSNKDYKIVKLLIESGANLDNINDYEMTPRLLAESIDGFDYKLPTNKLN